MVATVEATGGQAAAARALGISRQRIHQILNEAETGESNESKRARYAANRDAGKCSCGRKSRPDYKTCKRCADANERTAKRNRDYAKKHGCTQMEAQLILRTRRWTKSPLNPLSSHALDVLGTVKRQPVPRQEVNPGVVHRLLREALVELVDLPSPYKTLPGTVDHLRITAAGERALSAATAVK